MRPYFVLLSFISFLITSKNRNEGILGDNFVMFIPNALKGNNYQRLLFYKTSNIILLKTQNFIT